MDRPNHAHGAINPNTENLSDRKLNPNVDSYIESLKTLLLDSFKRKGLIEKQGAFIGMVLRVNKASKKINPSSPLIFDESSENTDLVSYVVRIPEIHSILPEPSIWGSTIDKSQGIIDLHPTFIAANKDVSNSQIKVGSHVQVDFGDRKSFSFPVCYGLFSEDKSVGAVGGNQRSSQVHDDGGSLQSLPQESRQKPQDQSSPREGHLEPAYVRGKNVGEIYVVKFPSEFSTGEVWVNEAHYDALLELVQQAQIRGFTGVKVTSGFRTMQKQTSLKARYGKAARPGYSPHQNGIAYDFNVGGNNPNSKEYQFLDEVAPTIGLVNKGKTYSNKEYWHWEFV